MTVREQTKVRMRKFYEYGNEVTELVKVMYNILNNGKDDEKVLEYLEEKFFSDDFEYLIDFYDEAKKGSTILKNSIVEYYTVDTGSIKRFATKNEIEQGVRQVSAKELLSCKDTELFRLLCFIYGVQKSDVYLLKRAGLNNYIRYNIAGKAIVDYKGIIKNESKLIDDSIALCKERNIEEELENIDRERKKIKISYPDKAMSEITENIDINTITFNIKSRFPYNSTDANVKRARAIVFGAEKYKRDISLKDKQLLRDIYDRYCDKVDGMTNTGTDENIKRLCELAEKYKIDGLIDSNNFCFKIISTVKSKGYKGWSDKQKAIVLEAIEKAEKQINKEEYEEFGSVEVSDESNEEEALNRDLFKVGAL